MMTQVNFDSIGGGGSAATGSHSLTVNNADNIVDCGFKPSVVMVHFANSYPSYFDGVAYSSDGDYSDFRTVFTEGASPAVSSRISITFTSTGFNLKYSATTQAYWNGDFNWIAIP